jgi:hypothetical protein
MTDLNSLQDLYDSPWDDLPAYALNALDRPERARVDALLRRSAEARAELEQYLKTVESLGLLARQIEPPARVRENLVAQADRDIHLMNVARREARSAVPTFRQRVGEWLRPARVASAGAAAALIAAVGIAAYLWMDNSRLNSEAGDLRSEVAATSARYDELAGQVESSGAELAAQQDEVARLTAVNAAMNEALKNQQWLTYVTNSREFRVPNWLVGGPEAPEANGSLAVKYFDDAAVLLVSGLPPAPSGYQYMLWLVREGVPEPIASFQVNEAGMARVEFDLPGNINLYESVVVSRELSSEVINRWPDAEVMATSNGAK